MAPPSASPSALLQRCGDKVLRALLGSPSPAASTPASTSAPLAPPTAFPPLAMQTTVPIWSRCRAHSLVPITFAASASPQHLQSRIAGNPSFCHVDHRPLLLRRPRLDPGLDFALRLLSTDASSSAGSDGKASQSSGDSDSLRRPPSSSTSTLQMTLREGLPQLTLPLPSRNEPCVFTLKPVTHTVGDLLAMLRAEDAGIDRAVVRTDDADGVRVASTTSIQTLLRSGPFRLVVNDTPYTVWPPPQDPAAASAAGADGLSGLSAEEVARMGDVRALVGQLYEALNVEEHQAAQEQRLVSELESLKAELLPLEQQKSALSAAAERRTNQLTWVGLGLMSVQFGILARLTWWEYSWDIMEPVTYFVTYGTAMACYAYFVLTKNDYILPDVRDRQFLISFHRKAKREAFDADKYNQLKDSLQVVEQDLRRLRDPLRLRLPQPAARAVPRLGQDAAASNIASQLNMDNIRSLIKNKLGQQ